MADLSVRTWRPLKQVFVELKGKGQDEGRAENQWPLGHCLVESIILAIVVFQLGWFGC